MTDEITRYYLSRHDDVTGPYSVDDIQRKLRRREINTLYKIEVDGEWEPLRTFLARLAREKSQQQLDLDTTDAVLNSDDIVSIIEDGASGNLASEASTALLDPVHESGMEGEQDSEAVIKGKGVGIASFILALLFFVPALNLICFLLSLIFGFLSYAQLPKSMPREQRAMPWLGVSISSIQGGFLVVTSILILITVSGGSLLEKQSSFVAIHVIMLAVGVQACVFACLLMFAVHLMRGFVPRFYICYVCSLLPLMVYTLFLLVIEFVAIQQSLDISQKLILYGAASLFTLLISTVYWPKYIHDDEESPLSYFHAAVASFFCQIMSALIAAALHTLGAIGLIPM